MYGIGHIHKLVLHLVTPDGRHAGTFLYSYPKSVFQGVPPYSLARTNVLQIACFSLMNATKFLKSIIITKLARRLLSA